MSGNKVLRILGVLLASATSGGLVFCSDHPFHFWYLQAIALIPWIAVLASACPSKKMAFISGTLFGLTYTVPLVILLELPTLMGSGLAVYLTLLFAMMGLGIFLVMKWRPLAGAIAAGAIAVLIEWIDISLVPVFGTAQLFTRTWSAFPPVIQFVALTGPLGLVFALVAGQALLTNLALRPDGRRSVAVGLAVLLGALGGINAFYWLQKPKGSIRVAAMGWNSQRPRLSTGQILDKYFQPMLRQAVEKKARLLVTPETGFSLKPEEKQSVLDRFSAAARKNDLMLMVGYFDQQANENHLVFIDPQGAIQSTYRKSHLIAGIEGYNPGNGRLAFSTVGGFMLGGMICQDDNFTDLARGYGRNNTELVAVPTNDWRQVNRYHLENSPFRGMENRYGMVRAATNGTSAIISAKGEFLAAWDHLDKGAGLIVADLPIYPAGAPYSTLGDWLALASLAWLVLAFAFWRKRD